MVHIQGAVAPDGLVLEGDHAAGDESRERADASTVWALHQALCALDWLLNARTGTASRAMLACLLGVRLENAYERTEHPRDPTDFLRCLELLDRFPAWRSRLGALASLSPAWAHLVRHWDELEALYRLELAEGGETARRAPRTYVRMKERGL